MNTTRIWGIVVTMAFALIATEANGAVTWTQMTNRDSEHGTDFVRTGISGNARKIFYRHTCQTNDCNGVVDRGSIYEVEVATQRQTRIITGSQNVESGCQHVSADQTGAELAVSCAENLLGDLISPYVESSQVFIINNGIPIERITNYTVGPVNLKPNITSNGRFVCWVSPEAPNGTQTPMNAYKYDRATGVTTAITNNTSDPGETLFVSCTPDGNRYAVLSELVLDPDTPIFAQGDTNIYYWDGTSWHYALSIGATRYVFAEPMISENATDIFFAQDIADLLGGPDSRRGAFVYTIATGIARQLFNPFSLPSDVVIANFVAQDTTATKFAISSTADLTNVGASGENVFYGVWTETDLVIQGDSPIEIDVTDPHGRRITKDVKEIPEATYYEMDFDRDGDVSDRIVIDPRLPGRYDIKVKRGPDAESAHASEQRTAATTSSTPTYSLKKIENGVLIMLASNLPVPPEGSEDAYSAIVSPPIYSLDLHASAIRSQSNGHFQTRATFNATSINDAIVLALTPAAGEPLLFPLGDASEYITNKSGTTLKIEKRIGLAVIRVIFRKTRQGKWQARIKGVRPIDLSSFAGASDLAVNLTLTFGSSQFSAAETFQRHRNQNLSFHKR